MKPISTRLHLAHMRAEAMRFRDQTSPKNFSYPKDFSSQMDFAASAIRNAIAYRNMARNLGEWKTNSTPC